MADDDDPYASIIDDCLYSSSQEDLLTHSKFAREDETFADDGDKSPLEVDIGRPRIQSDGADVTGGSNQAGLAGVRADCDEIRFLGFPEGSKSSTIDVVFEGEVRVNDVPESEKFREIIEPPLKKSRVSDSKLPILKGAKVSPLVLCSEKMVIDNDNRNKQIVVFKGGLKVEIVRPLRCIKPDGVECTEKQIVEAEHATQNEIRREKENSAKKKLEFEGNMEDVEVEEEQTTEPKNRKVANDACKEDGNGKGAENRRDSSREIEGQEKRELPSSLLGKVWGWSGNESDGSGNGIFEAQNKKGDQRSIEENGDQKSKTDESVRHLLDALRMLATQMLCDTEHGQIDIFETAQRHGMTFPRSRFLVNLEKDK